MIERILNSLRTLASPPEVQRMVYPLFVVIGDEMVDDLESSLSTKSCEITSSSLEKLLKYYDELSCGNDEFWSDVTDERWEKCRKLAMSAIAELGYAYEKPKKSGAYYANEEDVY